jgi:hypothetical protein
LLLPMSWTWHMYYQWMMVHFLWHWLSFFDFSNTRVFRASAPCSQSSSQGATHSKS